MHILLVDDDKMNNRFVSFLMKKVSVAVELDICLNGEEAVQYLTSRQTLPDLVLLDINMPLMDGYEFLQWYTQSGLTGLRVVICSSAAKEEEQLNFAAFDCVIDYLEKPISLDLLQALLTRVV